MIMSSYLFIESRDPFDSRDSHFVVETATQLKRSGVLAARKSARNSHLPRLAEEGITLLADDFSLRERGIQSGEMLPDIAESSIDALVDLLVQENTKAIWH